VFKLLKVLGGDMHSHERLLVNWVKSINWHPFLLNAHKFIDVYSLRCSALNLDAYKRTILVAVNSYSREMFARACTDVSTMRRVSD